MKKRGIAIYCTLALVCILGLAGCKQVRKGIPEWKAEGNIEQLVNALNNKSQQTRIAAARALGELKAEAAVEPLAAQFARSDPQLLIVVVDALAAIGNEPAETHLIAALELQNFRARIAAAKGLGSLKSTRALDALAQVLDSPNGQVATAAAVALGQIGNEASILPLAAQISQPSYSRRLACIKALESIGGPDAATALFPLLGDKNHEIRKAAIATSVATGKVAEPQALAALRNKNAQTRLSAVTILKGIDRVPSVNNKNHILYLIAQIPFKRDRVDTSIVIQLAEIGDDAVEILLKAVAHTSPYIREHAFRALEIMGEPCVARAIKAVEIHAHPAGKQWFSERDSWEGAPSWRLDLWGAITALNPDFEPLRTNTIGLSPAERGRQILYATQANVSRESIPLLIPLLVPLSTGQGKAVEEAGTASLFGNSVRQMRSMIDFRETTEQRLRSAGDRAIFPLMAAAESASSRIAEPCAKLLLEINAAKVK